MKADVSFSSSQTEAEFQQAILDLARLSGWLCYHTHDSRRSEPGFPDLVLVRPWKNPRKESGPELIIAELKSEKGRLTQPQKVWLDALTLALRAGRGSGNPLVVVWKPSDWPTIERVLSRRAA